jgi:PAS domain S-box-containing protein
METTLPETLEQLRAENQRLRAQVVDLEARAVADRARAEEALRAREAQYRQIVETAQEGIWAIDADAITTFVNAQMAAMLGYTTEEMIGAPLFAFLNPDDQAAVEQNVVRRRKGIAEQVERRFRHKCGADIWVLLATNPLYDHVGTYTGAIAMAIDISDRKRAEDALRASEARFHAMIENGMEGVILIGPDLQTRYVSPTVSALLGYPTEIFATLRAHGLCHPDDMPWLDTFITTITAREGATGTVTTRLLHQDGSWRWMEQRCSNQIHNPAINAIIISFHDVTERVRAAQALQANQQRLFLALDAAQLTAWEWDLAAGTITYSAHEASYFQLPPGQLTRTIGEVRAAIYPPDFPAYTQTVDAALQLGAPYQLHVRVYAPDGQLRWLEVRGLVQHDGTGQALRVVGVTRDISVEQQLQADARAAQQAAAESLARLDALITSVPSGIGYLDDELRYQLVNPALARINGRTPAEHLGRTMAELLPGLAQRLEPLARQVLTTGEAVRDLELHGNPCPLDGMAHEWLISYFPVPSPTGAVAGVGVIVTDITERIRADQALRDTERKLGTLIQILPVGISIFNAEGTLVYVNPALEQILRMDRADLLQEKHLARTYLRPDGTLRPREELARVRVFRERQAVTIVENGFITETGEEVWASVSAVPVDLADWQAVIATTDITRLKHAQDALRESETRYRTLFETMAQGVAYHDPEGRVIVVNPAAQRILGLSLDQLLGHSVLEPGWDAIRADGSPFPGAEHPAMVAFRTGLELRDVVMGVTHPGITGYRWLCIHAMPQFMPGATTPAQVYTIFEDITERKRDEAAILAHADALSRTNAELTCALRLKDEFLAMMSHELRTPLNVILGYTEGLTEEIYGPLADRQREVLDQVISSGRHLLAILSDILDLANLEVNRATLDPQPIDVEALCRSVMQFVQTAAQQQGVRLLRTIDQGVSGLVGDERRLTQILVNLLDNAIKFTPPGGRVGLDVVSDTRAEHIQFVVWDTGIGIAAADCDRIFQPFVQLDARLARSYEGIGLGLSLVRRLVDLHGGSIQLESTPGRGSRFTVSMPWSEEDNVSPSATRAPIRSLPTWATPPRLVIADDHEATLVFYRDLLTQQGCQVALARTGIEAITQVRATTPDVAVLDIQMPELDGLTAIRQIRADPAVGATPIIVLTALVMPGDKERCLAAGANTYLAKPVGLHTLVAAITDLLTTPGM